eukprot:4256182-Prymnesium_polylepis.1
MGAGDVDSHWVAGIIIIEDHEIADGSSTASCARICVSAHPSSGVCVVARARSKAAFDVVQHATACGWKTRARARTRNSRLGPQGQHP